MRNPLSASFVPAVLFLLLASAVGQGTPDFAMAADPSSQFVVAGSSSESMITLASIDGFAGTVSLTLPVLCLAPFCPGWHIEPNTLVLDAGGTASAVLTFSTTGATLTGDWIIKVTGTSGSLSHSVHVTFTVVAAGLPDFSLTASELSVTIPKSSSQTVAITLTSVNSFSGTITLTTSLSPTKKNGPVASLSQTSVTLPSLGVETSTLTITSLKNTPPLDYTLTVTGTSGSLSHSVAISVIVIS